MAIFCLAIWHPHALVLMYPLQTSYYTANTLIEMACAFQFAPNRSPLSQCTRLLLSYIYSTINVFNLPASLTPENKKHNCGCVEAVSPSRQMDLKGEHLTCLDLAESSQHYIYTGGKPMVISKQVIRHQRLHPAFLNHYQSQSSDY